jgi:hypothetical protein
MNISILLTFIVAFVIIWNLRSGSNGDVAPRGAYRSFAVDAGADAIKLDVSTRRRKPLHTLSSAPSVSGFAWSTTDQNDMPKFEVSDVDSTLYMAQNYIPGFVADSSVTNWD